MAVVFFEGFDIYGSASDPVKRGWVQGSASIGSMQTGRFGTGKAFELTGGNNVGYAKPLGLSTDNIAVGFAFRHANIGSFSAGGDKIASLRNGSTEIMNLSVANNGSIRVHRSGTLIANTAAGMALTATWCYVEFEIVRHASAGEVRIYVNGSLQVSLTGLNTGASTIDQFTLHGGVNNIYFDDIYFCNVATRLGECMCEVIRPSADTATKDWTRSTGADNYANVDDTTFDSDTTYNSSATATQKDLFDMANLASTPASVKAVATLLVAKKDNAETKTFRTNLKSGATTTNGTTRSAGTDYQVYEDIYETNPDTAGAWSGASVDAIQLGYELVS